MHGKAIGRIEDFLERDNFLVFLLKCCNLVQLDVIRTLVLFEPSVSGKTAAYSAAYSGVLHHPTTSSRLARGRHDQQRFLYWSLWLSTKPRKPQQQDLVLLQYWCLILAINQTQSICSGASSFWAALQTAGLGHRLCRGTRSGAVAV